jgi:DNA-binding protein YbaB
MAKPRTLDDRIDLIAKAVNDAKAKTIARINKQLQRMSPDDVAALERLIGKR